MVEPSIDVNVDPDALTISDSNRRTTAESTPPDIATVTWSHFHSTKSCMEGTKALTAAGVSTELREGRSTELGLGELEIDVEPSEPAASVDWHLLAIAGCTGHFSLRTPIDRALFDIGQARLSMIEVRPVVY